MPRVPPVTIATLAIPTSLFCRRVPGRLARAAGFRIRSTALDAHGDAHAATDAERRQPLLGVALAHLVQQRHEDPRARGADRMTKRNGAAIDVHFLRIESEILVDGAGL